MGFNAQAIGVLRDHLKRSLVAGGATSEFVFTSDEGQLIRHSNPIRRWWKPLLRAAKMEAEKAVHSAGDDD
jgi:hypothetical protein